MKRIEFLEKAHTKHNYKYRYINLPDKIILSDYIIVEYKYRQYRQKVSKHLLGKCPEKNISIKTTNDIIIEFRKVWGDKYDYSQVDYKGALIDVKIVYDGVVYLQRPTSHLKGMSPEFRKTPESIIKNEINKSDLLGETEIKNFLEQYNIEFIEKYKIDDIIFDFYLDKLRICIEFDGRQHFEPNFGIETFNNIRLLDTIKNEYCEDNYLDLIRIRYDDIDNIYQILWNNLKDKIIST